MEYQAFDVCIDRPVHQFNRIFHQCLVLRVAYTCRIDSASVVFGKGCKLLVDDRLVTVIAYYGRFQIVRDNSQWCPTIEMQSVFASLDKIALLLRPHSLAIRVVATG